MKVAVAGAGIAGLAVAAFLARAGHQVVVYDQFGKPEPVGSGLMIQPVGMAVLDRLGLGEKVRSHSSCITRVLGRNEKGRTVLDLRYQDLAPDAMGWGIQRGTLFNLLLQSARNAGAELTPSVQITGVQYTAGLPQLLAGDTALDPADLVLDCLGSSSLLCPKPATELSYGALWGLLDWPENGPFDEARLEQRYHAASRMVGVLPVGQHSPDAPRKLTFFWSLRADDLPKWRETPLDDWKAQVRDLWPDTEPLLGQVSTHEDLVFARYAHRTLYTPARGRLAHLGDSFHATSPQLGQGANMGLLDALAMSEALQQHRDPAEATHQFQRMRMFHVGLYQTASWVFTPVYQSDSRVLPWLRDRIAAPLSRAWSMPGILAQLVAGELADPLGRILGPDRPR